MFTHCKLKNSENVIGCVFFRGRRPSCELRGRLRGRGRRESCCTSRRSRRDSRGRRYRTSPQTRAQKIHLLRCFLTWDPDSFRRLRYDVVGFRQFFILMICLNLVAVPLMCCPLFSLCYQAGFEA